MNNDLELKNLVREKYAQIAAQEKETNQASCCGAGGCSTEVYNIMSDDYTQLEGYNPDADLGLGCGLPTQFARQRCFCCPPRSRRYRPGYRDRLYTGDD